jgi:hypothetical protein
MCKAVGSIPTTIKDEKAEAEREKSDLREESGGHS